MKRRTLEEVGAKVFALDAFETAGPHHWALKPRGSAFPYFCCFHKSQHPQVKASILFLDGWQTFHDFVRMHFDSDFGFYLLLTELPHFEVVFLNTGEVHVFRDDPCYTPRQATDDERDLCARLLWEAYGVLLRLESDPNVTLMYAGEQAMFARVEGADGTWRDEPLEIPAPRAHVEEVRFDKKVVAAARDLPMRTDEPWEVDLCAMPGAMTREKRPRKIYELAAVRATTGEPVFRDILTAHPETGLRGLWESMPQRVLAHMVTSRGVPGELRVASGRMFRLLRPLCMELSFKLSRVQNLPRLAEFRVAHSHTLASR